MHDFTWVDQDWSGQDLPKFCGSGLDRIEFYRIRTGLGSNWKISQSTYLWFRDVAQRWADCENFQF